MHSPHPLLELSALEQSCPRGYVRPLFCFSTTMQHESIGDLLARGLEMTKKAIPTLSCHLVRDLDSQQEGRYILVPSKDAGTFHVKDLRGDKFEST